MDDKKHLNGTAERRTEGDTEEESLPPSSKSVAIARFLIDNACTYDEYPGDTSTAQPPTQSFFYVLNTPSGINENSLVVIHYRDIANRGTNKVHPRSELSFKIQPPQPNIIWTPELIQGKINNGQWDATLYGSFRTTWAHVFTELGLSGNLHTYSAPNGFPDNIDKLLTPHINFQLVHDSLFHMQRLATFETLRRVNEAFLNHQIEYWQHVYVELQNFVISELGIVVPDTQDMYDI